MHELIHLAARAALANHAPRRHRTERWRAATVAFDQRWHWTACANDGDNVFIRRLVKITLIMGRKARFMMFAESVLICPRRAAVPWQLINYPPLRHTARSAPCRWRWRITRAAAICLVGMCFCCRSSAFLATINIEGVLLAMNCWLHRMQRGSGAIPP